MSILVTGAGGMVGSHMVEILFSKGEEVIGTFYKPTVDITEIDGNIKMIECDVRYPNNIEKIILKYKPTKVFHLAAQSYPTVSWEKPYETIDTNVNGTIAVFEAIKKAKLFDTKYDPVVVVACSSAEYGGTLEKLTGDKVYVKEDAELLPLHPYGVSKVGQDLISYQYFKNDGIKCIRARIFNSTGTRKVNDVTSDFTKRAVIALKSGKKELTVGNIDSYRAIMDQRDLINALLLLSDKGTFGDVYNISSEHVYQIKEIIKYIEEDLGISFSLVVDKSLLRSTDEKIIVGDISKLKSDTGWCQQITMKETIHDMLEYWKKKIL
jgi:nucleoside-diphosphate-sugar epimerase